MLFTYGQNQRPSKRFLRLENILYKSTYLFITFEICIGKLTPVTLCTLRYGDFASFMRYSGRGGSSSSSKLVRFHRNWIECCSRFQNSRNSDAKIKHIRHITLLYLSIYKHSYKILPSNMRWLIITICNMYLNVLFSIVRLLKRRDRRKRVHHA